MFDIKFFDANKYPITQLTQWDENQEIKLGIYATEKKVRLNGASELHLYNEKSKKATIYNVEIVNNMISFLLPDEWLKVPYDINFYIYLNTKTIAKGTLGVVERIEPERGA